LRQNGNGAFAIAETTDREFPVDFFFLKLPLDFPSIRAIKKLKADGALTSGDTCTPCLCVPTDNQ